jgi:L-ribulose-5-phosphate 3-epimerase
VRIFEVHMLRRTFVQSALALAALPVAASDRLPIAMAVEFNMLPQNIPVLDRFQMAKDAGFERIECPTTPNQADAEAIKAASDKAALPIHSVMNSDHWKYPFSSPDPAIVEKSLDGARTSIRNAHLWRAETVLLVPAVVNAQTTYREAYQRSQPALRKLLPLAEELKVTLALEEVWN